MTAWQHKQWQAATAVLLPLLLSACAMADQYRWTGVEKIVALSDPHGDYPALVKTLGNTGLVDEQGSWTGSSAHLVITGDLLDRGPESRKIMDLVMRLEAEALAAGGRVHLTLGNHEVMNLVGDLRYVSREEYAAFAADESSEERERWYQWYREHENLKSDERLNELALRAAFDKSRPPGFFAHRNAFGSEGKYGQWLLQKPLIVVVNETAFVHGGLPPIVAELGLDGLNDQLRAEISDYLRQLEVLIREGLISPGVNFYDHVNIAERVLADNSIADNVKGALKAIPQLNDARVHDSGSPLWYRGTVGCGALTEGDVIAAALNAVGARRVVVGHTPTVTRQVLEKFDGQVIEIDTGMLSSSYQGSGNALVIEGETLAVISESDATSTVPVAHPRRVGVRDDALTAAGLEQFLLNAEISMSRTDESDRQIVELSRDGKTISALFMPAPRSRRVNTELAAYRLDRLLGLDMVPVTVPREVDGKRGTLQFMPENSRDEAFRAAGGHGNGAWCPLQRQWNSMYVFDALVHNEVRSADTIVYSPENWQLLLMGHANAFASRKGRPKYLDNVELQMTSNWVDALRELSDEVLRDNLSDVLDNRRISALGERRDMLLNEAGKAD